MKLWKLDEKSAKLQIFAKKMSTVAHARAVFWTATLWRRVGARAGSGRRVVYTCVFVTSSRSISYICTLGLGKLWEFYLGFRMCALINSILVISHIGETYSEDVRGQAMLRGFFWPRISEWAVVFISIHIYSFLNCLNTSLYIYIAK